jgi:23S rRNA pseudouridine1911/1915/1917 synthase
MQNLTVPPEYTGKRLDSALATLLNISRSALQRRVMETTLLVNQKKRPWSYKIKSGDSVCFEYHIVEVPVLKPEAIPFDIVYEDEALLVLNKPAGLVVHAGGGTRTHTLVNGLLQHFLDSKQFNNPDRPGIVHRLDKDTSGVMVVAKNEQTLTALQKQFSQRAVEKEYRAVVVGNIKQESLLLDSPIGRNPKDRKKMNIAGIAARDAVTEIQVLQHCGELCYIAAFPKTGRTHQIRVHLSSIKHPILGDLLYGSKKLDWVKGIPVTRQMLHAYRLKLTHPKTGQEIEWKVKIPPDMQQVLDGLENRLKTED